VNVYRSNYRLNSKLAQEFLQPCNAVSVIIIVNSRFQKRSRGNQLIHRRLKITKLIGSDQDPESGRQIVRRLGWMVFQVKTGREV